MDKPRTRYAKCGHISVAYQVFGDGPLDLVYIPGWVSNIDYMWEDPDLANMLERLSRFCRVIIFDKRGTGLSDRDVGFPTLDERMDDLTAVMDGAGSERAALLGFSEGGNIAMLFGASFPERVSHLILFNCFARRLWAPDYPWASTPEARDASIRKVEASWGEPSAVEWLTPSRLNDAVFADWLATFLRQSASPGAATTILRLNSEIDVRDILPTISVPTLILHRRGDKHVTFGNAEFLADHIPGSKLVALPGQDHLSWTEDQEAIFDAIEPFLTGTRREAVTDRLLATILITDIVGSTEMAVTLGDEAWQRRLNAHNEIVRSELARYRGREINTTGDGFVVAFDAPARAISCAFEISSRLERLGLTIRAGVHTGECHVDGDSLGGVAIHIGARVADLADAGEVVVSRTVKDLVVGSGYEFTERGTHNLKGVPGKWTLFVATPGVRS
jgi:pimeloyl-ACP methyl ester carboxylesterase